MSIMTTSAHCTALAVSRTLSPASAAFFAEGLPGPQTDDDLHAGIPQVVGVGESLAAVADDGHLLRAYPLRT